MLTNPYALICDNEIIQVAKLSPFEAKFYTDTPEWADGSWQGDPERFSLVANETIKVGTPVNRNDADYWISQFARLGAMGEGERVGRVKVEENAGACEPVTK